MFVLRNSDKLEDHVKYKTYFPFVIKHTLSCEKLFPPDRMLLLRYSYITSSLHSLCLVLFKCLDVRCPALAVNQLVKTSPNSCVTSQMKYNTKCSFKCPLGFILKGPSYTQCGSNGRWTNSAKRISCTGEFSTDCAQSHAYWP